MKKYVVLITGATASGKSDFSIKVAQELNGEVINADIGSMYTPLTIGTAKPDWKNEPVAHHLFDILNTPQNFTVVQFRNRLIPLIDQILQKGKVPIVVGGSAFYIKAFFFKQHEILNSSVWVEKLEQQIQRGDIDNLELWQELNSIDPARAVKIHAHDTYRLIRAISIFKATGKNPSAFEQVFEPIAPFVLITCKRDRQELYQRIDDRVQVMMKNGWLQEVENLQNGEWEEFLLAKKLIGYDDLLKYLKSGDVTQVISLIAQKTRNYAKRQIIFLNKLEKDVKRELQNGQFVGSVQDLNLTKQ
jgi:tRNA dimethylallyltransferase